MKSHWIALCGVLLSLSLAGADVHRFFTPAAGERVISIRDLKGPLDPSAVWIEVRRTTNTETQDWVLIPRDARAVLLPPHSHPLGITESAGVVFQNRDSLYLIPPGETVPIRFFQGQFDDFSATGTGRNSFELDQSTGGQTLVLIFDMRGTLIARRVNAIGGEFFCGGVVDDSGFKVTGKRNFVYDDEAGKRTLLFRTVPSQGLLTSGEAPGFEDRIGWVAVETRGGSDKVTRREVRIYSGHKRRLLARIPLAADGAVGDLIQHEVGDLPGVFVVGPHGVHHWGDQPPKPNWENISPVISDAVDSPTLKTASEAIFAKTGWEISMADSLSDPLPRWPVPEGWKKETIPFPLEFAPEIKHVGTEELRFAPGMFKPDQPGYWSYGFVWWVEEKEFQGPDDLAVELRDYFRGLLVAVAKEKKLALDPEKIIVSVRALRMKDHEGWRPMAGEAEIFDAFGDGRPLKLTLWVYQRDYAEQGRRAVLVLASPAPAGAQIWKDLNDLRDSFPR